MFWLSSTIKNFHFYSHEEVIVDCCYSNLSRKINHSTDNTEYACENKNESHLNYGNKKVKVKIDQFNLSSSFNGVGWLLLESVALCN